MTSLQVHSKAKILELPRRGNSPLPVCSIDEQSSGSDPHEMIGIEDLCSMDDLSSLEKTTSQSPSPDESTSLSLEIPSARTESMVSSKHIGRLQRWKYCLIGEPTDNTSEKNTHIDSPINRDDNERQIQEPFLVRKLFGDDEDTEIDLSDLEESNPKVNSQSCNLLFSLGKDESSKPGSKSMSSDFNVTVDQSDKDLKNKLDSLKTSLNNDEVGVQYDCRICHCGSSSGKLVSPCYCTGTMGQMHASCLEQWLGSNGRKDCELCGYRYHLCREPRSFREFLNNPGGSTLARHLKCDLFCFAVLTPTTVVSVSLLLFAANLLEWKMTWSVVGLISTAVFLIMIYVFWSMMAFNYQRNIWKKWRQTNQVVRLKCTSTCDWDYKDSHQATTASEPSLLSETLLHPLHSTLAVTSAAAISVIDSRFLDITDQDPEVSVSNHISVELCRLSQSLTDLRAALSASSSSTCTFSSEPSLLMDPDLSESSSQKRLSRNTLKCDSIQKKD